MFNNSKDTMIVALMCAVCILGTYVYLSKTDVKCSCDHASIVKRLNDVESRLTRPIGNPTGSPLGSPAR